MKHIFAIVIILIISLFSSCSSKKIRSIVTEKDTVEVLNLILNNKKIYSELTELFYSQQLRIVKSKFISKEYKLFVNNKPVIYSEIDSTSNELKNILNPLYYVNFKNWNLSQFNDISKFSGILQYKSIGVIAEFDVVKKDNVWQMTKLQIGQY